MSAEITAPMRLLRREHVESRTGLKRTQIYDLMDRGEFPRSVKLGKRSVAWVESEVQAWVQARVEARLTGT